MQRFGGTPSFELAAESLCSRGVWCFVIFRDTSGDTPCRLLASFRLLFDQPQSYPDDALLALVIAVTPSPRGGGRRGPSDDRRQQSQPQLSGDFIWRQAVAQGSACGLLELPGHALLPRCRSGRRSAPAPRVPDGVRTDCPRRSRAAPEDGHDDRFFASCSHAELRPHGWGHSVPFDHSPSDRCHGKQAFGWKPSW